MAYGLNSKQQINKLNKIAEYGRNLIENGCEIHDVQMRIWNKYGYRTEIKNSKLTVYGAGTQVEL